MIRIRPTAKRPTPHEVTQYGQAHRARTQHGIMEALDVEAVGRADSRRLAQPEELPLPQHVGQRLAGMAMQRVALSQPSLGAAYEGIEFVPFTPDLASRVDLVFTALPHGQSQPQVATCWPNSCSASRDRRSLRRRDLPVSRPSDSASVSSSAGPCSPRGRPPAAGRYATGSRPPGKAMSASVGVRWWP